MSLMASFVFGILALDFLIHYRLHRAFGDPRATPLDDVILFRAHVLAEGGPTTENGTPNALPSQPKKRSGDVSSQR